MDPTEGAQSGGICGVPEITYLKLHVGGIFLGYRHHALKSSHKEVWD